MNKEELEKYIKKHLAIDVYFKIELYKNQVLFYLYGYDNRRVCEVEIPYKNRLDKKNIYLAIAELVKMFDFSFKVSFDNTKDIYFFMNYNL